MWRRGCIRGGVQRGLGSERGRGVWNTRNCTVLTWHHGFCEWELSILSSGQFSPGQSSTKEERKKERKKERRKKERKKEAERNPLFVFSTEHFFLFSVQY